MNKSWVACEAMGDIRLHTMENKRLRITVFRIDLCMGGTNLNCMSSPGDKDYWSTGIYREVFPPVLLVVIDFFLRRV